MKLAVRMLIQEKQKTIITILGVGIVLTLLMFLSGIYAGVKAGVSGYVSNSPADIWICQKNSTNLIRSSSFINAYLLDDIKDLQGVKSVESILRLITTADIKGTNTTLFVLGIQQNSHLGKPLVVEGTSHLRNGEIIIDASFARSKSIKLHDTIKVQNRKFKVVGYSDKTNATVAQFSFILLQDARELLGFPNITSFILVEKEKQFKNLQLKVDPVLKDLAVFDKNVFIDNNIREMETGIIPILFTIALLGFFSGGLITTLMLFSTILERKDDYALLKAVGMKHSQLISLVLKQSLTITILSFVFAIISFAGLSKLLTFLVPVITLETKVGNMFVVLLLSIILGSLGSIVSIRKISKVYPAEVFRA